MRTNIEIDDKLMRDTARNRPTDQSARPSSWACVHRCCGCASRRAFAARGKLGWQGDLDAMPGTTDDPFVDSSVWIDYFRGVATAQTEKLDVLLGTEPWRSAT